MKCRICPDEALPIARAGNLGLCAECRRIRRNKQNVESHRRCTRRLGPSKHWIEPVVKQAIFRQYVEEGMRTMRIADLHDIHPDTVIKIVKKLGGTPRGVGKPRRGGQPPVPHGEIDLTGAGG